MVGLRILLAGLIAISIAALPAAGEAIPWPGLDVVMTVDQADMPCCPSGDAKTNFNPKACIFKCAAQIGVIVPAMTAALPYLLHRAVRTSLDDSLQGIVTAPPTHPPPV